MSRGRREDRQDQRGAREDHAVVMVVKQINEARHLGVAMLSHRKQSIAKGGSSLPWQESATSTHFITKSGDVPDATAVNGLVFRCRMHTSNKANSIARGITHNSASAGYNVYTRDPAAECSAL